MKKTPENILNEYWGYHTFRNKQREIIEHVLTGKDTLALLPTGGGKSLCFQLPALLFEGITIVVSPLIALMKDQVMQLTNKGIKAISIPGGLAHKELDQLLDNCIYGNYKFLYLSPERLQQDLVLERIKQMPVSLIAIDEAHCISQWGHDFRPAYRNIIQFRKSFPNTPCIALTATATERVKHDIIEQLNLDGGTVFQTSFTRPNLTYSVTYTEDKLYVLSQLFEHEKGSAIVYVRSRKSAVKYASYLKAQQITANFYHGGLTTDERNKRFTDWMQNKTQVMVATNAFGMGIDKPDVTTVLHVELPESIESYFQEAGRAGRDNQVARSIILYSPSDKSRVQNQFINVLPTVDNVRYVYKKLNSYFQISYGEGMAETLKFNFSDFCRTYELNTLITYNSLQILERNSILSLSQEFSSLAYMQFKVSPYQLSYALIKSPSAEEVTNNILRIYGGIFDQNMSISLSLIAKKANTSVDFVHQVLLNLAKEDIIDYKYKSYDTAITFLVPREDAHTINPIVADIEKQNKQKLEQINAMLAYVANTTTCRAIQLLDYFGETKQTPCQNCDICIAQNQVVSRQELHQLEPLIIELLKTKALTSRKIVERLAVKEQLVIEALKTLLEKKQIHLTDQNTYYS